MIENDKYARNQMLFIDGQWCHGQGETFCSYNPATYELIWEGHSASPSQVSDAVAAARAAFMPWADLPLAKRIAYLQEYNRIVTQERNTLCELISRETGKPLWEAQTEVGGVINKLQISIQSYEERTGTWEREMDEMTSSVRHRPHGVMAVLGPFNFPAHLPNGHIIPALLAGNTIVFKASEHTPLVAEFLLHCWHQAKLPAGVINLVQGGSAVGKALSGARVDGVLFTGSSNTGHLLHQQYGGDPECLLALEMGGNNPLIVWDVDNIPAAVYNTIQSAFITSGQRCTCARRLIIADNAQGDAFLERLITTTRDLIVGPYTMDPEPFMGPVISLAAAKHILSVQEILLEEDAACYIPSQILSEDTALISPGIIDVTEVSQHRDEEIFGPLLQVYRCDDFTQALQVANNTRYGLAAGILTDREDLFRLFYRQIRAGIVNWNRPLTGAASNAPFGGVGASGNHRASAYYAADYCSYPVASLTQEQCTLPQKLTPGVIMS